MRRKNKKPCITFHLNAARRSPKAAPVCVRFPGNPMNSVLIRKPGAGNSEKPGRAAFPVCVRFLGNPMKSVLIRKPGAGNSEKAGPAAASVCVRFPGNPMKSVLIRKPGAGNSEKPGPAEPQSRPNQKTRSFSPPAPTKKAGGCRLNSVPQSVPLAPARTLHRTSGPGRPGCF